MLRDPEGLQKLQAAARRRGGECLATEYETQDSLYPFRCAKGHVWTMRGGQVLRKDHWCFRCMWDRRRQQYYAVGLARLKHIVKARGGVLHSQEYRGSEKRYALECDQGHTWEARAINIFQGSWCPECAHAAQISNRKSKARLRYQKSKRHAPEVRSSAPCRVAAFLNERHELLKLLSLDLKGPSTGSMFRQGLQNQGNPLGLAVNTRAARNQQFVDHCGFRSLVIIQSDSI